MLSRTLISLLSLVSTTFSAENNTGLVINTSSGLVRGLFSDGVRSFKGIPYAKPPVGKLRWKPPQAFKGSNGTINATQYGPACIQQFPMFDLNIDSPENEDCLSLNIWAPEDTSSLKPVLFWIHGGAFTSGTAAINVTDGTSFAKNQDLVVVTINYRLNIFGFPQSQELFPKKENLGMMDQELALQWVLQNIAGFGGDKNKITIQGQSSGSVSVAYMLQKHADNPPFRAAIMESGAASMKPNIPSFEPFNSLASAVGCNQTAGDERLACLKGIPADTIRSWLNGPDGAFANPIVDNVTVFANPIERITQNKTARVPILIGSNQDEGTLLRLTLGQITLADFLNRNTGGAVTVDQARAVYSEQNETRLFDRVAGDFIISCAAGLTAGAYAQSGIRNTYRYAYGAVFDNLQIFPGAGAWHGSEILTVFGTLNVLNATDPAELTLSESMQTMWANFIKDPTSPPGPNWPEYVPDNSTNSLAKLAYEGNVQLDQVVVPSPGTLNDGPCEALWNQFMT